ncbi:MAG: aspartate kinase [bacterium]|nr:aspartate kinase [bacterium]
MSKKSIIVNKFGGGILKKNLIPFIEDRIKEEIKAGFSPVVVVSALPGVTDELIGISNSLKEKKDYRKLLDKLKEKHTQTLLDINLSQENRIAATILLIKTFNDLEKKLQTFSKIEITNKEEDAIISYGEKLSANLFSVYLKNLGVASQVFYAEDLGILTDDNFKNSNIFYAQSEKSIQKIFKDINIVPVIPGFTGMNKKGETTTLGRGGTDTTACFIGAVLRAEKVILWKDVGGVMSANPKIVKNAKTIPFISYQEAEEAGKIIHDKAIQYVKMFNTPIEITSLADPKQKTTVGQTSKLKHGTKIVSYKKDLVLFTITDENKKENDLLAISSNAFFKNKVDIILISNTQYSIQIVADNANGKADVVFDEINKKVKEVDMHSVSMIYLVGNFNVKDVNEFNVMLIKMKTDLEISAFLYKNCTRIEAIIKEQDIDKIINALHKKFIK